MDEIALPVHESKSTNAIWHLDSRHKLVACKFSVSGVVDGFSCFLMWIEFSNNDLGSTAHDLFKEAINKNLTLLQVRGEK